MAKEILRGNLLEAAHFYRQNLDDLAAKHEQAIAWVGELSAELHQKCHTQLEK